MKKKNTIKRIASAALAAVMAFPMLAVSAFAAEPNDIITEALPDAVVGENYSVDMESKNANRWSAQDLPGGLTIDSAYGIIRGKPAESGTFDIWIQDKREGEPRQYVLEVLDRAASPGITTEKLPDAEIDKPYRTRLAASGGALHWAESGLPEGLEIDPTTGVIKGTPAESGEFPVKITASNSAGSSEMPYRLYVAQTFEITTGSLPDGEVDASYQAAVELSDDIPVEWTAMGLPKGLAINRSTGVISGVPAADGSFDVRITAKSRYGIANATLPLTIAPVAVPVITTEKLPEGTVGENYSATLQASGTEVTAWTVGRLPKGLTLDKAAGTISGVPLEDGSFTAEVSAEGKGGVSKASLALNIAPSQVPYVTDRVLPEGTQGEKYRATISYVGADAVKWMASGLPNGLTIDGKGVISGTPKTHGSFEIFVTASNDKGGSAADMTLLIHESEVMYTVKGAIDNGGTITGTNPQNIAAGGDSSDLKFAPAKGFRIVSVQVNGKEVLEAPTSNPYTFSGKENIAEDYDIVVKTERIPSVESGLGIDNTTVNYGEGIAATNAGGSVKVGSKNGYDALGLFSGENTVSFIPASGWEHDSTFEVIVNNEFADVARFTMKVPSSNGPLYIAAGSQGTQAEWDTLFPHAKASVRGESVVLQFADKAGEMPYQVQVKVKFIPTLKAKSATSNGTASASNLYAYAEADSKYKITRVELRDPAGNRTMEITSLPRNMNSKGEFYDRDTGDFAGILTTKIAGKTAKVWVEGNLSATKKNGYVTEMDLSLDQLPIALEARFAYAKRNASDTEQDADYDEREYEDNTGNLTIRNVVKDGSKSKAFTFHVFFPQDARDDEYEIKGDVKGYVKHGSSITLYAGEQATIYGLPEGAKYSVEMADPGSKYTTAFSISNGEDGKGLDTGFVTIRDGKLTTVEFTNTFTTNTDTPSTGATNPPTPPVIIDGGKKDNPQTGR